MELRNIDMPGVDWCAASPQRRCEAWSFAMIGIHSRPALSCFPQRRCEAWSFAMSSYSSHASLAGCPQRRCEAWSFAMVAFFGVAAYVDASSTKVRSVELRNPALAHLSLLVLCPQRRCEAWSFAISRTTDTPTPPGILNEGAKRGASQFDVLPRVGDDEAGSSTKVRSVELRNSRSDVQRLHQWRSSTKVRSVELRNHRLSAPSTCDQSPQRRCEAWSFAMVA